MITRSKDSNIILIVEDISESEYYIYQFSNYKNTFDYYPFTPELNNPNYSFDWFYIGYHYHKKNQ